jgi:hypothetical protein
MTRWRSSAVVKYVGVGLIAMFGSVSLTISGQEERRTTPVVTAASAAFYPRTALLAHIDGVVRIEVATDGRKVSSITPQSGPPMLVEAAKENIQTWHFDEHKPTKFVTTFEYGLEDPAGCDVGNSVLVLRLPSYVKVTARRVHSCDPISAISPTKP